MKRIICAVALLVLAAGESRADPYGTLLGTVNGVQVYSNGSTGTVSNAYYTLSGYQTGMKWQCVELCSRYYWVVYKKQIGGGDASTWYDKAAAKGLKQYANGGTTIPQVGDILCSGSHVCIVRAVNRTGTDKFEVLTTHQNWMNNSSDLKYAFNMTVANGRYTIAKSGSHTWKGWLRR
jgi:hypothetical protein